MKLAIFTLFVALAVTALAVTVPQKAVIVTYESGTPDSVLEKAKQAIKDAGGKITHEYNLIK
jgi:hypothetical protein